jgi:hypothetical protein
LVIAGAGFFVALAGDGKYAIMIKQVECDDFPGLFIKSLFSGNR